MISPVIESSFFCETVLAGAEDCLAEADVVFRAPELYVEAFLPPEDERWEAADIVEDEDFFTPVPLFFDDEDFEDEAPLDEVERFAVDLLFVAVEVFPDEANVIPPGFGIFLLYYTLSEMSKNPAKICSTQ